jgi:hypothetical protein
MRIPPDADINTQAAFRELEGRVSALEALLANLRDTGTSASSDISSLKADVAKLERKPNTLDFTDVFRASGTAHALGYVPDPGTPDDDQRVLTEQGWQFPFRGVVKNATNNGAIGDAQKATDIVEVNGALAVLAPLSAASVETQNLTVYDSVTGPGVLGSGILKSARFAGSSVSGNKIGWSTDFNEDTSNFSITSTTRVTIAKAGTYLLLGNARTSGTSANGVLQIELYKNGSRMAYVDSGASSGGAGGDFVCCLDQGAANDYYEIFCNDPNPVGESTAKFNITRLA